MHRNEICIEFKSCNFILNYLKKKLNLSYFRFISTFTSSNLILIDFISVNYSSLKTLYLFFDDYDDDDDDDDNDGAKFSKA